MTGGINLLKKAIINFIYFKPLKVTNKEIFTKKYYLEFNSDIQIIIIELNYYKRHGT